HQREVECGAAFARGTKSKNASRSLAAHSAKLAQRRSAIDNRSGTHMFWNRRSYRGRLHAAAAFTVLAVDASCAAAVARIGFVDIRRHWRYAVRISLTA